jgi:hypothetical protein
VSYISEIANRCGNDEESSGHWWVLCIKTLPIADCRLPNYRLKIGDWALAISNW